MSQRWIFSHNHFSDRWGNLTKVGMRPAGGIRASEWFNVETGAGFLLHPDGKWNEGGRWHLFYIAPGTTVPVNADEWIRLLKPEYPRSPVSWRAAEERCIGFVQEHLIGEVVDIMDMVAVFTSEQDAAEQDPRAAVADEEGGHSRD